MCERCGIGKEVSFSLTACANCGHPVFPPRALCPVCGRGDWTSLEATEGRAEAVTIADGVAIAEIKTDVGPVVVARVTAVVSVGDRVRLSNINDVASAKASRVYN